MGRDGDGDQLMTMGGISKGRTGLCSTGTQVSPSACSEIGTTIEGQFRK